MQEVCLEAAPAMRLGDRHEFRNRDATICSVDGHRSTMKMRWRAPRLPTAHLYKVLAVRFPPWRRQEGIFEESVDIRDS